MPPGQLHVQEKCISAFRLSENSRDVAFGGIVHGNACHFPDCLDVDYRHVIAFTIGHVGKAAVGAESKPVRVTAHFYRADQFQLGQGLGINMSVQPAADPQRMSIGRNTNAM